ncbi:hypothetical protein PILCRDRAFT_589 [Piloderma croceum F 1598]|uniref:Uncharacterized protein n=1 Tax=Piloderma croceum (strain F 1598) TaxID=765440 RepID=A0A0C3G550_PILCF|nr:hypothetical protein PILCRDRAFT_589 [Piloderma croceum F 1598]
MCELVNTTPIPTLFGYTTPGEFSRARELTLHTLLCVHAMLPVLLSSGTSVWIIYRKSPRGFSVETQLLLLTAFLLRYTTALWHDVSWDILFIPSLLFLNASRLLRVVTSLMMVVVLIRYSPQGRMSLGSVIKHTAPFCLGCLALANIFRRMGLVMDTWDAPSMTYLASFFLEATHLLPQTALLFTSTNRSITNVTIFHSLAFLIMTMCGIAERYVAYTMFGIWDFWERAVWLLGVKVASVVIGSGCLFLALSLTDHPVELDSSSSGATDDKDATAIL